MNYIEIARQNKRKELLTKGKISTPTFVCKVMISDDELTPLQRLKLRKGVPV